MILQITLYMRSGQIKMVKLFIEKECKVNNCFINLSALIK